MSVEPTSPPATGPARPQTVLLVDDEDAVREFVRVVLVQAGYAVTPAADAAQALGLFQADPEQFDLVLSDVLMPGRNGAELAGDLRGVAPDVRILFMSATLGGTTAHPVCLPDGAELLDKPFSLDRLLQAVAQAISAGR